MKLFCREKAGAPVTRGKSFVEVGNYYFEGLQLNDGEGCYPYTDDCVRFENGMESMRECRASGKIKIGDTILISQK